MDKRSEKTTHKAMIHATAVSGVKAKINYQSYVNGSTRLNGYLIDSETGIRLDLDIKSVTWAANASQIPAQEQRLIGRLTHAYLDAVKPRGAVTIIKDGGAIDLTAVPFSKGDGASYSVVVKATGYQDLAFTLEVPKQGNHSSGSSGSSSSRTYSVTVEDSQNGTVTASPKRAEKGDTVSVTASANSGYAVSGVTVKTTGGDTVKVTDNGNGKYTFTMPAANVTVTAAFSKTQTTVSFADVSSDSYCADAVKWAVENGVTNGTTATTFSPNAACTRGQIVTFLWRAAGSPAPKTTVNPFTDVAADAYYAKAVLWAVENGITNGTTATTFSPDAPCTRAQAVTFLFRGAIANGLEAVTLQDLISGFSDAASLPGYAMPAMNWALANGIVQGNGEALMPNNTCTRSQIVTFLYRTSK